MYLKKKKKKIECSGFNLEALLSAEPGFSAQKTSFRASLHVGLGSTVP